MDKPPVLGPKIEEKIDDEKFKKGDYSVHIFIEESKGLLPVTADKNFNPVIVVKCFSKAKCTRKLKDVTSGATSIWSEHIYFSQLGCSVNELESQKILIEVKDSKTLRDSLIGLYEMDFTYVYFQPKHCILHKWVILSNPYSEDISVQRGLLKIGVNVLHESDKPEDLTARSVEETLLIPPQVNVRSSQLVIQIIQAVGLPKMDDNGTCDAYCVASFGTVKNKTKFETADKATMSARWFTELWLPVCQPCISNRVSITIWDYDLLGKDELIGSLSFSWDKIQDEANSEFRWANIYGAPDGIENEAALEMNNNEKLASNWRGRILIRLYKLEVEKATIKNILINSEATKQFIQENFEVETEYQICAQVFEAVNLPKKTGSYSIVVKFSSLQIQSKPFEAVSGCCKWYESIKRACIGIPNGSILPDVFIYLILDKQPICFARLKADQFKELKPKEKWIKFTPNLAIGKVSNPWEGGYVLIRIFVDLLDAPGFDQKFWSSKLDPPQIKSTKKLVCNLYQCRNLPPSDPTGLADPYVKILCGASEISTDQKGKLGILNPMWYESFSLDISVSSSQSAPPIVVEVWDYDIGTTDDMMGICTVDMSTVPQNPADCPRPSWYKLSLGTDDTEEGEILMSFMIVDKVIPNFFMPKLKEVSVEIFALGFRDLKPALGWLPVSKPFIKIDLNAIQFPGEQSLVTELTTQPNSHGPNANIGAVLSFKTKIPIDPLFCPNFNCTVYDYLLSGKSQPVLGNFTFEFPNIYAKKLKKQELIKNLVLHMEKNIEKIIEEQKKPEGVIQGAIEAGIKAKVDKDEENYNEDQPLINEEKILGNNENQTLVNVNTVVVPEVIVKRQSFSVLPLSISEAQESGYIVKMPQFKLSQDKKKKIEIKFKDAHYTPLGYNRSPNDGKKHYRYTLDTSLEKSNLFGDPPFERYSIKKGQVRGVTTGFFSFGKKSKSPQDLSTLTEAGVFKGLVRIKTGKNELNKSQEDDGFEKIAKLLLVKTECIVRVYIIDAYDLEQKDLDSPSDPYLVLKLGNKKINDRDNAIFDTPNPKFLKHFDITATFTGESALKVQIWDHNKMFKDEKIGTTKIDLEDRFFNETWKSIPEKPIEIRKILVKSCKQPKGFIRLWVEIHPSHLVPAPLDLSPKPPEKFELRLIIWRSEDVPNMDIEGVSDLYVVASVNEGSKKETDTHYRAQSGAGSWNWRMKFPLLLDENSQLILNMSIWDRDLLSANDAIGDACLDLTDLALQALETGEKIKKLGTSEKIADRTLRRENEKFFVDFKTRDTEGKQSGVGKLLISIEILPEANALACINGEGRSEPNIEPALPAPEGRIQFTMNPIKMLGQMVGPELKQKICYYTILALCVFLCVMMGPMIIANTFTNILF